MHDLLDYTYLIAMIGLAVYSQLVMRWRGKIAGAPASKDVYEKIGYVFALLLDIWIISAIAATFFAGVCWMLALTKFQVSYAYPFTSAIYPLVMLGGFALFRDDMNFGRIAGT